LHAAVLGIKHPKTREELLWQAPMPEDMKDLALRLDIPAEALWPDWDSLDV
jgi:23S rRNA pseudouridine1911/1915/1917 synthase